MPATRSVGHRPVLQAGFGGNVLRGLRQFTPAQGRQQLAREDDTLPAMLGQSLFGKEVGALSWRVVASTLLRSMIPAFHATHPEVQVEVFIDDGFCDIMAEGFDAGFRLGDSVEQDMVATLFGPPM